MKLEIIKSCSIKDAIDSSEQTRIYQRKKGFGLEPNRREFFKLAGMFGLGALVVFGSDLLKPQKAHAGCFRDYYGTVWCDPYTIQFYQYYQMQLQAMYGAMLLANVGGLYLPNTNIPVYQPTSGTINLINKNSYSVDGAMTLTVADSRSLNEIEAQKTQTYSIPAKTVQTLKFNKGPIGQYPGQKKMTAWTAKGNASSPLTVYA